MSLPHNFRKVRVEHGRTMPNTAAITPATLTSVVSGCLGLSWGGIRSAAKCLARVIDTNERTASNLLEGRNAPSGATLVKLMAEDDEVFRAILKMAGRQPPAAYDTQIEAIKAALAIMEGKL